MALVDILPTPREPRRVDQPPKLLDQVRHAIRMRQYSIRTEDAYVGWIRRFIFFIRLPNGRVVAAELHWYEAHGIGKRKMKIKRYLK